MNIIRRYMGGVAPFIIGLVITVLMNILEPLLFPVIVGWTPTKVEHVDDTVVVSGYMKVARECQFISVNATYVDRNTGKQVHAPLFFMNDRPDNHVHEPLTQNWGPWVIHLPYGQEIRELNFRSTHVCHPGWNTTTYLGSVVVYE